MKEYRCKFCHKLLFTYSDETMGVGFSPDIKQIKDISDVALEIKCPKCKRFNKVEMHYLRKMWGLEMFTYQQIDTTPYWKALNER